MPRDDNPPPTTLQRWRTLLQDRGYRPATPDPSLSFTPHFLLHRPPAEAAGATYCFAHVVPKDPLPEDLKASIRTFVSRTHNSIILLYGAPAEKFQPTLVYSLPSKGIAAQRHLKPIPTASGRPPTPTVAKWFRRLALGLGAALILFTWSRINTPAHPPLPPLNCLGGCKNYTGNGCVPPIKGNVSFDTSERIYHVPGGEYYDQTVVNPHFGERYFCTEAEAQAAGWRRSKQ